MSTLSLPIAQPKLRSSTGAFVAYGAASFAVVLGYVGMHLMRPIPAFPLDDPYITLHSAQVLHSGFDANYPGVSALFGTTSAPFLGLVYVLLFALPPLIALDAACWLGILFYVWGLVRVVRTFGLARYEGLLLITLGLTASYVPFHLLNGLETSWALACVIWTLALASGHTRMWPWAALLGGVTTSVRPDLLPFTLVVVAALSYRSYQMHGCLRKTAKHAACFASLALLAVLPWAFWYYHATGVPFPLTGVAKRYFMAEDGLPSHVKIGMEAARLLFFIVTCGPLALAVPRIARHVLGKAVLIFFVLFLAAVYVQFPSAIIWNWFRYPLALIPMMVWALGLAITAPASKARRHAVLLLRVCVVYSLLFLPFYIREYMRECSYFDHNLHDTAAWCEQNLPPNSKLLVHDAGYIAYATHFRTIDFVGLKTPQAIPMNRRYTWPSAGAQRVVAVSNIARDAQAEYLIVIKIWPEVASLPEQMRTLGWGVDLLRAEGGYRIFHLTPPAELHSEALLQPTRGSRGPL